MKKIENILVVPALILLFYGISKNNAGATDFNFYDTFIVIDNRTIAAWVLAWLILVIVFFKIMRRRHEHINIKLAAPYIILTMALYLIFMVANPPKGASGGISDAELNRWIFYGQVRVGAALAFLLTQVIFLVYFVFRLSRKPAMVK